MCCGNKKKKIEQKPKSANVIQGTAASQIQGASIAQSSVGQVNPLAVSNPTNISSLSRSKLAIDKKLQKSQVKVQEIEDPSITNFFQNCKTQRIELIKITNEHNSYVRQHDYFDLSSGHVADLNNIKGGDLRGAMYTVSEGSTLSTPSVNKFYYDKEVTDIGYTPANKAYQPTFQSPAIVTYPGGSNTGNNSVYHSNVVPFEQGQSMRRQNDSYDPTLHRV